MMGKVRLPKWESPWKCVVSEPARSKLMRKGIKWFYEKHDIHSFKLMSGHTRIICKHCGELYR